jgi:proteic killer suppression protein
MIRSIKGSATRQFVEHGKSKFRGLDQAVARQRIIELNAAPSLAALSPLRSAGLHKLKGERKGFWAMSINGPWRLVFRFDDGNAHEVEIVDYH